MNTAKGIVLSTISLLLLFGVLEVGFRIAGYSRFKQATFQMRNTRMEPRPLFKPDTTEGLKLDSGTYKIYYDDGTYWQATNNTRGYRITSTDTSFFNRKATKRHIDIFGCSFTYGTGLADTQTYPFLLQKELPDYLINNYAVPGQGVAANFVKITQQIPIDSGAIIIYAYIKGHDFKTNHANRKMMYPSRNFLKNYYFLYLDESLHAIRTQYDYKPWPFIQYSSFLNFLEDKYLAYLDKMKQKHKSSKKAMSYLNELCKKKGARLVFVTLTNDDLSNDMLLYCRQNKIDCADLSVDVDNPKYNLMPYDNHPNFEANKLYAEKLLKYLQENKFLKRSPQSPASH